MTTTAQKASPPASPSSSNLSSATSPTLHDAGRAAAPAGGAGVIDIRNGKEQLNELQEAKVFLAKTTAEGGRDGNAVTNTTQQAQVLQVSVGPQTLELALASARHDQATHDLTGIVGPTV